MHTHKCIHVLERKWFPAFPYSILPSFLRPSIKMRQAEKVQFCATAVESLLLDQLASLPSPDPVIARPPQGPYSCATMWSPWQMRVGMRLDCSLGPLKGNSVISKEGWALGEPEALLNHSAKREAGREETQTLTLLVPYTHSLFLTTERGKVRTSEREGGWESIRMKETEKV